MLNKRYLTLGQPLKNSTLVCIYISCSALKFHASSSLLLSLSTCKVCGFWQLSSPMHPHPLVHGISFFSANAVVIGSTRQLFAFSHCQFHDSNWCSFFCHQYRHDYVIIHLPSIMKRRGQPLHRSQTSFPYHCLVICPLGVMLNAVKCWWQSFDSLFLLAENPLSVKY